MLTWNFAQADPGQINSLLSPKDAQASAATLVINNQQQEWPLERVVDRLDALMMVLKSCKQQSCTHPWESLHPSDNVNNLLDALSSDYDDFYREQVKVGFTRCEGGYIVESEGPQEFHAFKTTGEFGDDDTIYDVPEQQVLINPDWSLWE